VQNLGLIDATYRGTSIEAWSPAEALAQCDISTYEELGSKNVKSALFNAMINPLTKFAIKGINFYQGQPTY